ncbi:MAG: substrate-binding domain-containing protein [Actinomycetota bacterium]
MSKRAIRLLFVVLAFALVAAACSSDEGEDTTTTAATTETTEAATETTEAATETTEATTETTAAPAGISCDEPVKVGVITDQTGALAIYGAHVIRSFPLGMEYATGAAGSGDIASGQTFTLDGCEIEVIYGDDTSDAETSATIAREMIEVEGVDIIVGSVSSGVTAGIQQLAFENDVIHIAAPAAANDLTGIGFNPNSFRVSRNNYQDAVAICEYLPTQYSTFAQIAPDYAFGHGGAAAFRDACTLNGGEFVIDDIFAPFDTTDFTPYMQQILDSGAEAWMVTWAGSGFINMMQAAVDLGVTEEMALGAPFVDNVALPPFFSNGIGSTGSILYHYTQPDNPVNDWLIGKTNALETPVNPDLFDADAFNAALLVTEALKATGGDASAAALIDAMEGISFEGPKGLIEIRSEDHVAIQDMYVVTLLNVDDPNQVFFEAVETVRPDVPCLLEGDYADRCGDLPVGSLSG